jgi:hypothetical protein
VSESVNDSWVYDTPPEAAFRMLTRLDHLTEQAAYLGYERFGVRELREREGFFRVTAQRLLPEGRRGRSMIEYTQLWHAPSWDGTRRFDAVARFGGPALTVSGQGQLQPAGEGGSRYSMRLSVHSGARFFARQVERDAAAALLRMLADEHAFREHWLAGRATAGLFPDQRCA